MQKRLPQWGWVLADRIREAYIHSPQWGVGKRIRQSQGTRPQVTMCSIPIWPG